MLSGASATWLTTLRDGRVLLAANTGSFTLAVLDAEPLVADAPIVVVSALELPGTLAAGPAVRADSISLALERDAGSGTHALEIQELSAVELAGAGAGGKITICHRPPGNPAHAHTLRVAAAAVAAHMSNHGDALGPCP
ncbi:MAG: hypothetical protein HY908_06585 [Myxococcales bacterium]|nr:hypothetical protein [Myxococcales bacterium]